MLSDAAADSIGLTVCSSLVALLQLNLRRLLAHFFSFYVAHFFFYETYFRAEGIDLTVRTKFEGFVRRTCKLHSTVMRIYAIMRTQNCEFSNLKMKICIPPPKTETEIINKRILGRRNTTSSHPSSPIEKVTVSDWDCHIEYTVTHNYQSPSSDISNRRS